MMRWDPFSPVTSLREAMDRLLEESFVRPTTMRVTGTRMTLPIDMYETADNVVITTALPGADPSDVEISVTGDLATIRARIKSAAETEEAKDWNWLYHEVGHGEFSRSISLPTMVQADRANAEFTNGMLKLTLPKAEEVKPRQIKISAGEQSRTQQIETRTGQATPPTEEQAGQQMKKQTTRQS